MADWKDWVGDFKALQQKAVEDNIAKAFYCFLLARRDGRHEELMNCNDDYEEYDVEDPDSVPMDPYFRFETLDMVLNPKTKPKKKKDDEEEEEDDGELPYHTYEHAEEKPVKDPKNKKKNLKDADGKVVKEIVSGLHRVKKFATIGGDLKKFLVFLLNKFLLEAHQCYKSHDNTLEEPKKVLSQLRQYVNAHYDCDGISNFMIDVGDLIPIDDFINEEEIKGADKPIDLADYLLTRASKYFKEKKSRAPARALGVILDCYVTFLKTVAVMFMDLTWGKNPATLHIPVVEGIIRQLYMLLSHEERGSHEFQYEIFTSANAWVSTTLSNAKKQKETKAAAKKKEIESAPDEDVNNKGVDDELDGLDEENDEDDNAGPADEVDFEDE